MNKRVIENAKEALLEGVNKLANPVVSTIGARGKNVFIYNRESARRDSQGNIITIPEKLQNTKDGVTVAQSIYSTDPVEQIGIRLIQEVAQKTVDEVGDGTSNSTLLAQYLMNRGVELVKGRNHVEFCRGMNDAVDYVCSQIDNISMPVDTQELATQIATISANNDRELGELIGSVFGEIGLTGQVAVEEGTSTDTTYEVVNGMAMSSGFIVHHFINTKKGTCELNNPIVVIFSGQIRTISQVANIIQTAISEKRDLLVVADVDDEALHTMIVNKQVINICAVKLKDIGEARDETLRDLSAVTGAVYYTAAEGKRPEDIEINLDATAQKVIVSKNETKIIGGYGDTTLRKSELTAQLETSKNPKWIKSRLSMLDGGVARIIVGGKTQTEIQERKDRVDDAVLATQAAADGGFVAGGGATFRYIANNATKYSESSDYGAGYNLIIDACYEPEKKILENSGENPKEYMHPTEYGFGFDAKEGVRDVNLIERQIIDPSPVLKCCIKNSAANTEILLKTDYLITDV